MAEGEEEVVEDGASEDYPIFIYPNLLFWINCSSYTFLTDLRSSEK